MMNIYAEEGDTVIVTEQSINSGYPSDSEHAKNFLNVGQVYTVEYTDVEGWRTEVYVKEIPDVPFNSANFEDYSVCEQLENVQKTINMTNKEYGGCPAYPTTQDFIDTGLTKREYFAAIALKGILSRANSSTSTKYVAISAVQYADALINELNQKDDKI